MIWHPYRYGAHMEMLVNNGLNVRSLSEIAAKIVELRFNCVRLPYSLDSLNLTADSIPNPASQLCHNPELQAAWQRICVIEMR